MPVKRRIGKAHRLDDYQLQELIEGPDSCLIAGVGYSKPEWFRDLSEAEQGVVVEAMRADWHRYGSEIMTWWTTGDDSACQKPWCFVLPASSRPDGALPWAAEQFGPPVR